MKTALSILATCPCTHLTSLAAERLIPQPHQTESRSEPAFNERKNTWTAANGELWLRDFLPVQLAEDLRIKARILSYGYNSHSAFSKAVTAITDEAEMLLDRLRGERGLVQEKKCPIVLIAHSLGGILVKKIITKARSRVRTDFLSRL